MATRKETPDVLGELLGGAAPMPQSVPEVEPEPALVAETETVSAAETEPEVEPEAAPEAESGPAPRRKASRRQASRQRRTQQARWEYVEIVFCDYGGFRPRLINGKEVQHWKRAPLIHEYLNHLGGQGWELAGVGGRHKDRMPAYLKRLKA